MTISLEQSILSLMNNMYHNLRAQPLYLGGISFPGGGLGGPTGGYIGVLPQTQIAYDYSEFGTMLSSGVPSLLDNLNHIRARIDFIEAGQAGSPSYPITTLYPDYGLTGEADYHPLSLTHSPYTGTNYSATTVDITLTYLFGMITPAGGMGTNIPAGNWVFKSYMHASYATDIFIYVYKYDIGGVETELFNFKQGETRTTAPTTMSYQFMTIQSEPEFVLNSTDRLLVKYFGQSHVGEEPNYIILFHEYGNDFSVSAINLPLPVGGSPRIKTLNITVPPTSAELISGIGSPAVLGSGYHIIVDKNGAHTDLYSVISDGENWWYSTLTKAT